MTRNGHRLVGAATGIALAPILMPYMGMESWLALPLAVLGADLPDRIEWAGHGRWCEHRTITHWWPWWLALTGFGIWRIEHWWSTVVIGLGVGAISHLLVDWPNPTGIPIIHPWRRHSLRWWRSGEREVPIVAVCFAIATSSWLWRH